MSYAVSIYAGHLGKIEHVVPMTSCQPAGHVIPDRIRFFRSERNGVIRVDAFGVLPSDVA